MRVCLDATGSGAMTKNRSMPPIVGSALVQRLLVKYSLPWGQPRRLGTSWQLVSKPREGVVAQRQKVTRGHGTCICSAMAV